jgi:putative Ca2+/H+ antiporter (TMEM165/GDT1 family)
MDWEVFLATFGMLFLAELGDKTQLAVVAQVCRLRRPAAVFLGGALGLFLVTGLGVLAGQAIGQVVPVVWIQHVLAQRQAGAG